MRIIYSYLINKLSRPKSNKYIPEIDGLRFLSIFLVVLLHLRTQLLREFSAKWNEEGLENNWLYWIVTRGGCGVHIFFAISGFILAVPFAKSYISKSKPVNLKGYYVRRVTRLEPPFVISLILFTLVHIIVLNVNFQSIIPHFFASLGYVHYIIYGKWSPLNPVTWSLETEIQFYLLAPLLFMVFKIQKKYVRLIIMFLITILLISPLHLFVSYLYQHHLDKSLFMYSSFFMSGVIFANYYLQNIQDKIIRLSFIYDLIGIVALSSILLIHDTNYLLLLVTAQPTAIFFLLISIFRGKMLNKFFSTDWVATIGGMCYSIYLLHYPALALMTKASKSITLGDSFTINYLGQFVIVLPVVLLISVCFFLIFEKPFMTKIKKV